MWINLNEFNDYSETSKGMCPAFCGIEGTSSKKSGTYSRIV